MAVFESLGKETDQDNPKADSDISKVDPDVSKAIADISKAESVTENDEKNEFEFKDNGNVFEQIYNNCV